METKPRWYPLNVVIGNPAPAPPPAAGVGGRGSVTIQDVPFVWERMTFGMLTSNGLFPATGSPLDLLLAIPDGLFAITLKTDSHVYMAEPCLITAACGSGFGFDWFQLQSPVELRPKTTMSCEMITLIDRQAPVSVQLLLHGVEPLVQGAPPTMAGN